MNELSLMDTLSQLKHAIKDQLMEELQSSQVNIVPMQIKVLKVVQTITSCTAQDVAGFLRRDKAQVARLIKGLISEGLLSKRIDGGDRRSHILCLTHKGSATLTQMKAIEQRLFTRLFQGLSDDEQQMLEAIMTKLLMNMTES